MAIRQVGSGDLMHAGNQIVMQLAWLQGRRGLCCISERQMRMDLQQSGLRACVASGVA